MDKETYRFLIILCLALIGICVGIMTICIVIMCHDVSILKDVLIEV